MPIYSCGFFCVVGSTGNVGNMYENFNALNGQHPWRSVSRDGYVDYGARIREGGKVVYFNYALAKELGMVPMNHAQRMVRPLEKAILDTFALQIINEYDLEHGSQFPPGSVRPGTYMATRYLQAQHRDRRGLVI